MQVKYTLHLRRRLKQRKFPLNFPKRIYYHPDEKYFDTVTKSQISIKKLLYNKLFRPIMIAYYYDNTTKSVKIQTIHPETQKEITNRLSEAPRANARGIFTCFGGAEPLRSVPHFAPIGASRGTLLSIHGLTTMAFRVGG